MLYLNKGVDIMPMPRNTEVMVRACYNIPAKIKSFIRKRAYEQNKTETQVMKEILYAGVGLIVASEKKEWEGKTDEKNFQKL
jgi:hypothetical protein